METPPFGFYSLFSNLYSVLLSFIFAYCRVASVFVLCCWQHHITGEDNRSMRIHGIIKKFHSISDRKPGLPDYIQYHRCFSVPCGRENIHPYNETAWAGTDTDTGCALVPKINNSPFPKAAVFYILCVLGRFPRYYDTLFSDRFNLFCFYTLNKSIVWAFFLISDDFGRVHQPPFSRQGHPMRNASTMLLGRTTLTQAVKT